MGIVARDVSDQDIADLAAYYSSIEFTVKLPGAGQRISRRRSQDRGRGGAVDFVAATPNHVQRHKGHHREAGIGQPAVPLQ